MEEQAKFQNLLRDLFQFNCAELDFGIYRILNLKRDVIDNYIDNELPSEIEGAVAQGAIHSESERANAFKEARERAVDAFGEDAFAADGELLKYQETPLGKKYKLWRDRALHSESAADVCRDIYNHLYAFFGRYYQDGDFVPKRRYSWEHPYVVPYNGEELHFHWANRDQYYVKAAERFNEYSYRTHSGVSVQFSLLSASVEQNDTNGEKRFFFPKVESTSWDIEQRTVNLPFEYRTPTFRETKIFGSNGQQEAILKHAETSIREALTSNPEAAKALLDHSASRGSEQPVTNFFSHARRFTSRRTSDFFIHRELDQFLSWELENYLRSEVLGLGSLAAGGEARADAWLDKMRVIRRVGGSIITFLAQIESFQKMLWEKRKFVVDTQYCVAVGLVPDSLVHFVLECEPQWEEWKSLGCSAGEGPLFASGDKMTARSEFIQRNRGLLLDTRHFDGGFVDSLLAGIGDIDKKTDGVAIKSENWQALNLLQEKYREGLSCVYLDPPYNTAASAILYKNDYKDSSWIALMENRLRRVPSLLNEGGILCVAIDDAEYTNLNALLSAMYGRESILATAIVRSNPAGRSTPKGFSAAHEYALFVAGGSNAMVGPLQRSREQIERYNCTDTTGRFQWVGFRKHGGVSAYRTARPRLHYPLFVAKDGSVRVPKMEWSESMNEWRVDEVPKDTETQVLPIRNNGEEMRWKWEAKRVEQDPDMFLGKKTRDGKVNVYVKAYMKEGTLPTTWWDNKLYSASEHGTRNLKALFGHARGFSFPKSIHLVEDCIRACGCTDESTVLDFFAGSGTTGHAVTNLNREDGGNRKFVLVEVGEHFDTILLPRLKKVAFSPEWNDGQAPRSATSEEAERGPRIIKYLRMESYEDALSNIEFEQHNDSLFPLKDYLLRYMLQWETKGSATLLNVSALDHPFDYKLRLNGGGNGKEVAVDLPETFNFLLGLSVDTRRVYHDEDRRYLVYTGKTRDGRSTVVIWRNTGGWELADRERDRDFVKTNGITDGFDEIWMNGDSIVPDARTLDTLFKQRMFAASLD